MAQLARDIGLEEAEYLELLDLFSQTTRADLATIAEAAASGDARKAVGAAHSIKGAAANLGLRDIAGEARTIEERSREGRLGEIGGAARALEGHLSSLVGSLKE
ncbi:MAG: Hpt domain-containing protein [Candidatus Krumholzibacteriaceae bacterium]